MIMSYDAFFVKVSDFRFGGTYITLLNTMGNLGNKWPRTIGLWMVGYLTMQSCTVSDNNIITHYNSTLSTQAMPTLKQCSTIDGYYIEIAIGVVFGLAWLHCIGKKLVLKLQQFKPSEWMVNMATDGVLEVGTIA